MRLTEIGEHYIISGTKVLQFLVLKYFFFGELDLDAGGALLSTDDGGAVRTLLALLVRKYKY